MSIKRELDSVNFMNMCMVEDDRGNVLALDKVGVHYNGITFPGGHVEPGETFRESVIREVFEETGLTISDPVLCGIYHWYREGTIHCVGLIYRATAFSGTLLSSEEGRVCWIPKEEYSKLELAEGMQSVLKMIDDPALSECFMIRHEDGSITEILQ